MPWALASTEDFVNYTDHGVVLPSGGADAADYDCYTGCVIDDGDQLHLFYTGHNPARRTTAGDIQVVCHATSDGDPTQWRKHPDHTFGAPTGYLPEDWRDPYVYRVTPNEPWQLILAARHTEGPDRRRGVVARLTSTDLVTWHPTTPLWDPHRFITQECPEVFQWGDWWYLVYSEFSDAFQTRYRIARGTRRPLAGARTRLSRREGSIRVEVGCPRRPPILRRMDRHARRRPRRRRLGVGRRTRRTRGDPGGRRHPRVRAATRTGRPASPSRRQSNWCRLTAQPPTPARARRIGSPRGSDRPSPIRAS